MKKITLLSFVIAMTILSGCASVRNSETAPGLGTTLDAATTYYGLEYAAATEANPLLSWGDPVTVMLGSILLKQGAKYAAVNYGGADPFTVDNNIETAGVAAGVWNIGVLAGAHPAVALTAGIVSAYGYYQYRLRAHALKQAGYPRYLRGQDKVNLSQPADKAPTSGVYVEHTNSD